MPPSETELWSSVRLYVYSRTYEFSADGEKSIRDFIRSGVETALSENHFIQDGMQSKILFFADEMMRLAELRNTKLLTRKIFDDIKKKICPLHPFC